MSDPSVDGVADVVEGLIAAINAHDVDAVVAWYDEEITNHGVVVGRRGMRAVHELIFTTFPDWSLVVEDVVTAPGRAVVRGRLRGTHSAAVPPPADARLFGGALRGVEPAGRWIDVAAMHLWEVSPAGLVTAHWAVRDDLSMHRQATGAADG